MASRGLRETIQVEWFNVTYRSVGFVLTVVATLAAGTGGYWYYFQRYSPRAEAEAAIERAEGRLGEASVIGGEGRLKELLDNARVNLDGAQAEYGEHSYDKAKVAAIRSENLSLQAITMTRGTDGKSGMVRFYRIEGDVRVKQVGEFSWDAANPKMMLQIGDQVKTSSSASAALIYFDGTVTTIQPGSLLEIRDLYEDPVTMVRRVKENLNWGELKASTQKRNVSGSYHEVSTDKVTARSEDAGEFRVAFDKESKAAEFDVFDGRIQIDTPGKKESLVGGERIRAGADGRLKGKEALPDAPSLQSPSDQRVFVYEDPQKAEITLSWENVADAAAYHLMISDKPLFTTPLYDAERQATSALIEGVGVGSYHWKVAAVSGSGAQGPFSQPRRFRVTSQHIRDQSDTDPPMLEITDFVAIGSMVIVNGRTEPGANLWADNEKIDIDDSGTFYAVIRLRREGLNEVQFMAQDNAGNEATLRRGAFVERF